MQKESADICKWYTYSYTATHEDKWCLADQYLVILIKYMGLFTQYMYMAAGRLQIEVNL